MSTQIVVMNHSTVVSQNVLADMVRAVDLQVQNDLRRFWRFPPTQIVLAPQGKKRSDYPHRMDQWILEVLDTSDQAGALGYHDVSAGIPDGRVFAQTTIDNGSEVSVCLSHEVDETIIDPRCNKSVSIGKGRLVATEVGDPVEADVDGYRIGDVLVSNFVTPAWFQGAVAPVPGTRYDMAGKLKAPLTLRPGGYVSIYVPGKGWRQVFAREERGLGAASLMAQTSPRSWYRAVREESEPEMMIYAENDMSARDGIAEVVRWA